jgi:mannose-1-phosphate guanylyltransferase/mannose-6-phosphate isomerase
VQDVKKLVARSRRGRYEHALHREVFRPWGSYDSIENGHALPGQAPDGEFPAACCRCRCTIIAPSIGWWWPAPRASRAAMKCSCSRRTSPPTSRRRPHRIENPGKIPLHIIEVQSGGYLGEDDIVRFEDQYGREGTKHMNPLTCFKAYDIRGRIPDRDQRRAGLPDRPGLRGVRQAEGTWRWGATSAPPA